MFARALAVWLGIMLLAIANGSVRNALLTPSVGEPTAHVLSTIILCAVILLVAWLTIRWIGPESRRDALLIGLTWIVLTLAFEFLAGHYIFGAPWERILADYNLFRGRVWPLVPLTTLVAPVWVLAVRRREAHLAR
jgi:hypothetical protein